MDNVLDEPIGLPAMLLREPGVPETGLADPGLPIAGLGFGTLRPRPRRPLRIGIIASELPPGLGGMQEHARSLIGCLAVDHEIEVFTGVDASPDSAIRSVTRNPVLHWQMKRDLAVLSQTRVDAWITLNAGLASYSVGLRAPTFAYVHGNDFLRPWLPFPERRIRLARRISGEAVVQGWRHRQIADGLRAVRWAFSNSAFSRDLCARLYRLPEERFSVIAPGIAPEFFQVSDPGQSGTLRLITVSRLSTQSRRKNIDTVLEAIALLRGAIPIRYTVVGDGDDLPRLKAIAAGLGLADQVCFRGGIEQQALVDEFACHDAFILAVRPTEGDVEGFGMVFAQAAASGLPSIATAAGGIPEVVEDGVSGMLVDDLSASGLASALRRFRALQGSFDRLAIRRLAERFSAPACTAAMVRTITRMI